MFTIPIPLIIFGIKILTQPTLTKTYRIYLKGTRLVQIAYSSAGKAEFWNELSRDTMAQKVELQKELKRMFPNKEIGHPELLKTHFWEAGVHIWKIKKRAGYNRRNYSTQP